MLLPAERQVKRRRVAPAGAAAVYCRRMSVEPGGEAPVERGGEPPRLNRWVTGLALAVLVGLAALLLWPSHGLDTVERPEESLERLTSREMDLRAAVRTAPRWERRLLALAVSPEQDARADALRWYDEMVSLESSPLAELYRIVLLAEDGQEEAVAEALAAWAPSDDAPGRLAAWARAAYAEPPPSRDELRVALEAAPRELAAGWFRDRLVARLASRLGDAATRAAAEQAILTRGTGLLWRMRAILAGEMLLVLLAAAALASLARPPGLRRAHVATAPVPPHWTVADGVGLFARGAAGLVGVAVLWPLLPDSAWSSLLIAALSAVPILRYLAWYCRRSGTTVAETFGLRAARGGAPALAGATLALIGVSIVGDFLLDLVGTYLGLAPHWTDGFQESLVWGTAGEVLVDSLDSCVFAPVLEELLFRGVLYGTFRLRFGPAAATGISAGLFAVAHGYGVIGFASVLMSGVLWAVAYERTRSLLPGMLAHAANNVQATAIVLLSLRL